MPAYRYRPLGSSGFRLLVIHDYTARDSDGNIVCSLIHRSLADPPSYEALSYVWGQSLIMSTIMLRVGNTLARLEVTENLAAALQHLQRENGNRVLWVDAICINQRNTQERNQQVRTMPLIYGLAKNVCVWLGVEEDRSGVAMELVNEIVDLERFDRYAKGVTTDQNYYRDWHSFFKLMSRPWFTRRWVVQEIVLAPKAILCCGNHVVSWEDFADAVNLFTGNEVLGGIWDAMIIPAASLVHASFNICRRFGSGPVNVRRLRTLDVLMSTLTGFHTSDPRDTVFAVLGLAKAANAFDGLIDYNQNPIEVFASFIGCLIDSYGNLDMICVPWAPEIEGLPSWISQVTGSAFTVDYTMSGRRNADSLVGPLNRKNYAASGDLKADARIISATNPDSTGLIYLSANGFILDKICVLGRACFEGFLPKSWYYMCLPPTSNPPSPNEDDWDDYWENESAESNTSEVKGVAIISKPNTSTSLEKVFVSDNFWRTLVADRALDGSPPPSWYARACDFAFNYGSEDSVNTEFLIRDGPSPIVAQFLKRVQRVTWNRKFGMTEQNSSYCIVPTGAKVGDCLCILPGCSVPVLLRSWSDGKYRLVGECYVHEYMEGEAIERFFEGGYTKENFRIV